MQLYALNSQNQIVFARQAAKQTDYFCLECKSIVRRRGGIHRQSHFYHIDANRSCRQQGKSLEHLQAQIFFLNTLPQGECILEHPFPEINRIADVVWLPQKIIFEIQCSSIRAEEVQERNRDYASQGFQVVWIFHEKRFNQRQVAAAELVLVPRPHYYTNINADGEGVVYDQFSIIHKGIRRYKLKPVSVDVQCIRNLQEVSHTSPLAFVMHRLANWPLYFAGDLAHQSLENSLYVDEAVQMENEFLAMYGEKPRSAWEKSKEFVYNYTIRLYKLMFQILLERACK